MIRIDERMYRTGEVATLIGHNLAYVHALIESGRLHAKRLVAPNGRKGQWRVYPQSLREWLGVPEPRENRRRPKRIEREVAQLAAMMSTPQAAP